MNDNYIFFDVYMIYIFFKLCLMKLKLFYLKQIKVKVVLNIIGRNSMELCFILNMDVFLDEYIGSMFGVNFCV